MNLLIQRPPLTPKVISELWAELPSESEKPSVQLVHFRFYPPLQRNE